MRVQMVTMVCHVVTFYIMTQRYSGVVVARLPFAPFRFVQNLTHRNLAGDDVTECSVVFLYAVCSLAIKGNLAKALGFAPMKTNNDPFGISKALAEAEKATR